MVGAFKLDIKTVYDQPGKQMIFFKVWVNNVYKYSFFT